jgi:3-phosphoglycerate kinase
MDYLDKYDALVKLITEDFELEGKKVNLKDDFEKFFVRGNKTAGTRIRKMMQEIKKLSQEIRNDVQEYKDKI